MKPENVKCPDCDGPMKPRTNRKDGTKFWGCAAFPECRGTRDSMGMSRDERRQADDENRDPSDELADRFHPGWPGYYGDN